MNLLELIIIMKTMKENEMQRRLTSVHSDFPTDRLISCRILYPHEANLLSQQGHADMYNSLRETFPHSDPRQILVAGEDDYYRTEAIPRSLGGSVANPFPAGWPFIP